MSYFIAFLVLWVICSILTYGYSLAYLQIEYPAIAKVDVRPFIVI